MKLNVDELSELLNDAKTDVREIAALRERVLKLEHTTKELLDLLTDFRVNQIMSVKDDESIG